jgi:GNAT superfamily N-acetyltransferase
VKEASRSFVLRAASAGDAPTLAHIHTRARAVAMPWLPVLHSDEETRAWMANVVLPVQDVCIATSDDVAAGFIAMTEGWIEQLYVDPSTWRSGAGSTLLEHAKHRQPNGFRLWTFQRNAMARAFYRKHGLVELSSTDGYDNEEKEPDVLLGWKRSS